MNQRHAEPTQGKSRRLSFTLVELLISVALIALLASTTMMALYGVTEHAKETRTRAQIAKLHELIMAKWEMYSTRPVRLSLPASTTPRAALQLRLLALRETMRMELPDRVTDLVDNPVVLINPGPPPTPAPPSLWKSYRRSVSATLGNTNWYLSPQPTDPPAAAGKWSYVHQGSECLYLILSFIREGDSSGLDFLQASEIGDTDGDGMKEVLDGWGRPIAFLRWAPGFATNPGPDGGWGVFNVDDDNDGTVDNLGEVGWPGSDDASDIQSRNASSSPDPFDPLRVDGRATYALFPLIFSAGKDGNYGVETDFDINPSNNANPANPSNPDFDMFHYSTAINDPYYVSNKSYLGRPAPLDAADNITNHTIDSR